MRYNGNGMMMIAALRVGGPQPPCRQRLNKRFVADIVMSFSFCRSTESFVLQVAVQPKFDRNWMQLPSLFFSGSEYHLLSE
jgi:hypothetical protein